MEQHAPFSPSKLARIVHCPGSYLRTKDKPSTQSAAADRGTRLHEVMKDFLSGLTGQEVTYELFTAHTTSPPASFYALAMDDASDVVDCLSYLASELARFTKPVQMFIEHPISLEAYDSELTNVYGTADVIWVSEDTTHILDWKFGKGVLVTFQESGKYQLLAYAMGASALPRAQHTNILEMHIVQPGLKHTDVLIVPKDEGEDWLRSEIIPSVMLAQRSDAPIVPGQLQCKFCPTKATCRERYERQQDNALAVFQEFTKPKAEVELEFLSQVLEKAKEYKYYISELEKFARACLARGIPFPNWKLVEGRAQRQWSVDELTAIDTLEALGVSADQYYKSTFVTPAQAEKLVGAKNKKQLAHIIEKKPASLSLVPESDPRPAVNLAGAADVFEHLIDQMEE